MKWLILLFVLVIAGAVAKDGCHVREFYGIGYTVHDPTERYLKMMAWLKMNAPYCKQSDYVVIWNNIGEWAGTSDSVLLRQEIIHGYKNAGVKNDNPK
jgi:hypothetical protein